MLMSSRRTFQAGGSLLLAAWVASSALPPLQATAATNEILFAPYGESTGDRLGISSSGAGDVNGDGFPDVIVGAYLNDANGESAGRAYVYYGGPGADAGADLTLTGEAAGDRFGYAVAGAGDLDGDGYDDLIVGATGADTDSTDTGRAYVFLGGPDADAVPDIVFTGESTAENLGVSVSGAGDFNDDGYDDVVVGAYRSDVAGTDAGRACIYYGGPAADTVADLVIVGAGEGDRFGVSVSRAGDVNGDGVDDVIIGSHLNDDGGTDTGAAYVYYGGSNPDSFADIVFVGEGVDDKFGVAVAGAGDVNGDGYGDLIVGANNNDIGGADAGRAYVYFGGPIVDDVPDLTVTGEGPDDKLGDAVAAAGDVNDDGYDDVIIGAWSSLVGSQGNAGRIYICYGGPDVDSVVDIALSGSERSDYFGQSVSGVGDIDGDGYDDFVVGASAVDSDSTNVGRAYIYTPYPYRLLSPDGGEQWVEGRPAVVRWKGRDVADIDLSTDGGATWIRLATGVGGEAENALMITAPAATTDFARLRVTYSGQPASRSTSDESAAVFSIVLPADPPAVAYRLALAATGESALDTFGSSVSGAGDVNGDGYDDIIAGAETNNAGGANAGRAYVFYGGPGADLAADLILTGEAASDRFGASVAGAGDLNGDGYDDVVVGAYGNDAGGTDAGRAYVYLGGATADSAPDFVLTGEATSDLFGVSVATAGDVNGDGYDDVIVGAHHSDAGGNDAGRAYVYFGGPGADSVADLVLTGEAAGDGLGRSVATAGDVDGDGYDDVIVGANLSDAGGPDAGRAYVYLGGPGADAVADLVLTGEAEGDNFGISVSGAGDIDGDGHDDVIVGAYVNAAGGTWAGRAYVYHGGPAADSVADLVLTGETGDLLGISVAGAGDLGGDGYDDLIVGAWGNGAGRAYVYLGGPGADSDAAIRLTGEADGDGFGRSVCGAGDVDNDGHDDIIVGAPSSDAGGMSSGQVHLYECARYFLTSPAAGETWNVGAVETVSWLGAEPADLWLSVDGGRTHDLLRSRVGGSASNRVDLRVPHAPTRFARLLLTPTAADVAGRAESDSLFTIEAAVGLLVLRVEPPEGSASGAMISWRTDPGPDILEGYRLERAGGSSPSDWRALVARTKETAYHDADAAPGDRYRLTAINGLDEEYVLGQVTFGAARPLSAWPLPYRGGTMHVLFETLGGFAHGKDPANVALYDVAGRRVRTLVDGDLDAGDHAVTWDGRDESGHTLSEGVYFLRMTTAGTARAVKVTVIQ